MGLTVNLGWAVLGSLTAVWWIWWWWCCAFGGGSVLVLGGVDLVANRRNILEIEIILEG